VSVNVIYMDHRPNGIKASLKTGIIRGIWFF